MWSFVMLQVALPSVVNVRKDMPALMEEELSVSLELIRMVPWVSEAVALDIYIAPDKRDISRYFSYFSMKAYTEVLLMSTTTYIFMEK